MKAKPMSAINFIKDHGVDKAREVVEGAPGKVTHFGNDSYWNWDGKTLKRFAGDGFFVVSIYGISDEWVKETVDLSDLKRVVESVDMINSIGGIKFAKGFIAVTGSTMGNTLEQAISDYEQLFGNSETLELETLRDCDTSPNCKKFDEQVNSND